MGLRGVWICPTRSHALIGSIGHDGCLSANHWRRGHIASENHGWFRHRPLIARSRKLSLMMPGCYAPLSHFRMKLGAAGAGGQKSADRLRRQAVGGCFRTAKQNARRLGALERRYLDPRREALGTMGYARPRSHRHAGWSDHGADGGDVVVRAGARAIAVPATASS